MDMSAECLAVFVQVAYLSVSQFLGASDQLVLLLVNTWRSDLQNDNFLIGTLWTYLCSFVKCSGSVLSCGIVT